MNREGFLNWLKEQPNIGPAYQSEDPVKLSHLFASVDRLSDYLARQWNCLNLEDAPLAALQTYPYRDNSDDDAHLAGLYGYLGRPDLVRVIGLVSADKSFRHKKLFNIFKGIPDLLMAARVLARCEIHTVQELLALAPSPESRMELAIRSGLPVAAINRLVQVTELCRMPGMSGLMLRRSLAMGYDSLQKYVDATPDEVQAALARCLAETGDRSNAVSDFTGFTEQARVLKDIK